MSHPTGRTDACPPWNPWPCQAWMRGAAHGWLPQSLRSRRLPFKEGSRSRMTRTAVLLLIPFLLFLIGYYAIARNETKATLRAQRRGANGTRPNSVLVGAFRSVVPPPMTDTVGFSFMTAEPSMPTQRSSAPEILLHTLTARSNAQHWPEPPQDDRPIPVTQTSQVQQEAVSHEFTLSQDVKECVGMLTTSEPLRSFTFSDWLRRPYCRHSA